MSRRPLSKTRPPEPAADVLRRALGPLATQPQGWRLDIFRLWARAVGPKIAARTEPQSFTRGTLVVRAASATWQNELMFLRTTIVTRLNAMLGGERVRALRVVSGHIPPPAPAIDPANARPAPLSPAAVADAEACAQNIADPEVREAFAALMARTLTGHR